MPSFPKVRKLADYCCGGKRSFGAENKCNGDGRLLADLGRTDLQIIRQLLSNQVRINTAKPWALPGSPPRSEIASDGFSTASSTKSVSSSMMNAPWFGFPFFARPHSRLM